MSAGKLPEGWINTTIENISVKCSQRVPNENDEFIYVDIGSINRDLKIIENPQYLSGKNAPSRARKVIKSGDVIVSLTRPNLNAVALVNENYDDQIASTGFEVIHPVQVESRYVFGLVRSRHFIDSISGLVQGALYPAAKSSNVQSYEFPLPPLAEQKIIAEKLDTLLAQVDSTKARLEQIPKILKRFRQAVLAAAANGQITREWRDKENIRVCLSDIGQILTGSTPSKKNPNYYGGDFPLFKPGDLDCGYYVAEGSEKLTPEGKNVSRIIPPRSILITCIGATIGKTGFSRVEGTCNQQINAIIPFDNVVNEWLYFIMLDPQMQNAIITNSVSTTLPIINKSKFSALEITLPDKEVQHEIVRRVEQLFAYADTIEKQVNNALARVNNLTQSILAKAFRGELTAQWRAENPELISGENSAAALLEKIKAERAASTGKKASRKKS